MQILGRELRANIQHLIVPRSLKPVRKAIFAEQWDRARTECARLAEAGDIEAQACYAAILWDGVGGNKDCRRGEQCAKKAAALGSAHAQYLLAHFAHHRNQVTLAARYLQQSAGQQFPPAVLSLGRILVFGIGMPKDVDAGLRCYAQAQALGHRLASFVIWDYWSRMAPTIARRRYAGLKRLLALARFHVSAVFTAFDARTVVRPFG